MRALRLVPIVGVVERGVRSGDIQSLTRRLGVGFLEGSTGEPATASHEAVTTARAFTRRLPFPDTCLRRALYAAVLADGELVIGAKRTPDGVEAHAWVRIDGFDHDPGGDFVELRR